uniref:Mitochondrial calcium uniporter regulator 1 n=1 Tax=Equus caballus TaxID=9796 RepID=A0A9L0R1W4_HORSE
MQIVAERAHSSSGSASNLPAVLAFARPAGRGLASPAASWRLAPPRAWRAPGARSPGRKGRAWRRAHARCCCLGLRTRPRGSGAAPGHHDRALKPVSAQGMDCGSVAGSRPKRSPGRRRLLLFLPARRCGSPAGRGVPALAAPPGGLGALRSRAPGARASPLLLLLLVPAPRLAAAAPRRPLADWERSCAAPCASPARRGGAGSCPSSLGPRVPGAASALRLRRGPAAGLAAFRRELSVSAGRGQLDHKRADFASSGSRKLYFDTHALVCLLEENGFTTQQAEIIVSALVKIVEANMSIVYKDMVTKMQQEITLQQIMSQIANVKKDMIILEKSEFSALRAENEKIKLELHRLKQQMMDEVVKVRTDTKLDFNLEKSRVKELYSLNERKLLEMRTEMVALHAQQDRAVTQTDRKIDTEVAGLKTMLESHKLDNIKYLAGSVFTCLTVALGFYRLWI